MALQIINHITPLPIHNIKKNITSTAPAAKEKSIVNMDYMIVHVYAANENTAYAELSITHVAVCTACRNRECKTYIEGEVAHLLSRYNTFCDSRRK